MAQAFVWGQGGAQLTPEQVAQQRAIAAALMKEGSSYAPVGSWLEGLARVAQAGVGAYKDYQASQAEKAGQEAWQQKFAALSPSPGGPTYGGSLDMVAPSDSQDRMRSDAGITGTQANVAGVPMGYFDAIRSAESSGNDAAKNPNSSATGRYQFTAGTWNDLANKYPSLGLTADGRLDPAQQELAIQAFTADNAGVLQRMGIPINGGSLYAAHFLGAGDAPRVLSAPPETLMTSLVPISVIEANPFLANMTAGDFAQWAAKKGGDGSARAQSVDAMAYAPTDVQVIPGDSWNLPGGANPRASNPQAEVAAALMGTNPDLMPQQTAAMAPTKAGQQPMPQPQQPVNTAGMNYDPATGAIGPAAGLNAGATLAPAATAAFYGGQSPVQKTDTPILRQIAGLLGGGSSAPQQAAPNGQQAVAQALAGQPTPAPGAAAPQGMPSIGQLMELAADPYAPEGAKAVVNALIQQQLQQQDPAYRMGLEKSRLELEQMRNPQMKPIEVGGVLLDPKTYQPIYDSRKPEGIPDSVRALDERATRAGLVPGTKEYNDFMISGGQQGNKIVVDTGTIPQGYQAVRDADGRLIRYDPVPGGPADNTSKQQAMENSRATMTDVVTSAAELARQAATSSGLPTTGVAGRVASNLPETNAAEVRRQVAVLKSNATIESLNAMRQQSPTGGALGNVTEKEGAMLAAKAGALDPDSPNFLRDLDDYERTLLRTIHGYEAGDKIYEQTRNGASPQPSGTSRSTLGLGMKPPVVINGYTIEEVN